MPSAPDPHRAGAGGWGRRKQAIRPAPIKDRALREHASILIARGLSYLVSITPTRLGYLLCDRIGDLLYWRSRTYRLNVIDNLRHVYGPDISELLLRRRARMVFRMSARNFWDLLKASRLEANAFRRRVRVESGSWQTIEAVHAEGKGGIFLTAHLGAFDSIGHILYAHGYDPYVLSTPTVGKFIYAGVQWLRTRHNARVEDISQGSIRRLLRALKSGQFIGLVGDRDFTNQGLTVSFFGSETTLPAGAVRIARDTGVPIIPIFAQRGEGSGGQRYRLHIGEPIVVAKTDDEDVDLQQGIERVAAVLEAAISKMPEQWVMFQRVWHDTPTRRWKRSPRLARRIAGRAHVSKPDEPRRQVTASDS